MFLLVITTMAIVALVTIPITAAKQITVGPKAGCAILSKSAAMRIGPIAAILIILTGTASQQDKVPAATKTTLIFGMTSVMNVRKTSKKNAAIPVTLVMSVAVV